MNMQNARLSWILAAALCLSAWASRGQSGGTFDLSWNTVAGGGGSCAGANFSLNGTIGQASDGRVSGGRYTIDGGFWSFDAAVQTPGAPLLSIHRSGANVIISWPSPSTGFGLEQTSELGAPNWISVSQPPEDDNTTKRVTLPAAQGSKFYRLRKP